MATMGFFKYVWGAVEIYATFMALAVTAPLVFHGINNVVAAFVGSSVAGLVSATFLTLLYGVAVIAILYKILAKQIGGGGGKY